MVVDTDESSSSVEQKNDEKAMKQAIKDVSQSDKDQGKALKAKTSAVAVSPHEFARPWQ